MLYLANRSPDFNAAKASRGRRSGEKVPLARGVYCDPSDLDDLPAFMEKYAVRIADHLLHKAVLVHLSAYKKGPVEAERDKRGVPTYRLFVGSTYTRTVKLPHLEIVQTAAMADPRLRKFCPEVDDHQDHLLGQMDMLCAGDELTFLQNFGSRRYYPERFLPDALMTELQHRLLMRHGTGLIAQLELIVDSVPELREHLTAAMEYLSQDQQSMRRSLGNHVFAATVAWYGRPIGRLAMNGVGWDLDYASDWSLSLGCDANTPGRMPAFIHNMFPEGHQASALQRVLSHDEAAGTVLQRAERFLSSISVVSDPARLSLLPRDVLHGRLNDHCTDMLVFEGVLRDMPAFDAQVSTALDELTVDVRTPRISGNQAKLPCFLDEAGQLMPALDRPFTHILKFPGYTRDMRNARGALEWVGMAMARGAGVLTANFALVDLQNGTLGCVVERFDIPQHQDDMRMIFTEDVCSASGRSSESKLISKNGIMDVVALYKRVCTPNMQDAEQMLRLIYVNALVENGDFHLKNAAVTRVAEPNLTRFRSTRLSPAFDIMNTRYFSDFGVEDQRRETMVLGYKGTELVTLQDLREIGPVLGLTPSQTEEALRDTASRMSRAAQTFADRLPAALKGHSDIKLLVLDALARAAYFCRADFPDLPAFMHPEQKGLVAGAFPRLDLPPVRRERPQPAPDEGGLVPFDREAILASLEGLTSPEVLARIRAKH